MAHARYKHLVDTLAADIRLTRIPIETVVGSICAFSDGGRSRDRVLGVEYNRHDRLRRFRIHGLLPKLIVDKRSMTDKN